MKYGFIIAAGNQSRFSSPIPKALQKFNGICILDHNIKELSNICDKIYVVCSFKNKQYFNDYDNLIAIDSGYGSGDAIYKALNYYDNIINNFSDDDQLVICWGDTILNNNLVNKLSMSTDDAIIPCVYEENPYVQVMFNPMKVLFTKRGDKTTSGYHDMSIFLFNAKNLLTFLNNYVDLYMEKTNIYKSKDKEFEFLDIFNSGYNGTLLEIDKEYANKSFNTIDEFYKLEV